MDWRTAGSLAALLAVMGWWRLVSAGEPAFSLATMEPPKLAGHVLVLVMLGSGALVLAVRQYRRWRPHRTALYIGALAMLFVAGVAAWLGPDGAVTGENATTVRGFGLLLLLAVGLAVSRFLESGRAGRDGEEPSDDLG